MIIPGILEKDFKTIKSLVKQIDSSAHLIQIDVADGKFVDGKTFVDVSKLDQIDTKAKFELHLMVENPTEFLKKKINKVERVVAHVEAAETDAFVKKAKDLGYKVGLSLNPSTDVARLAPYMEKVDYVQFMTVVPGAQGNEFEKSVLDKITVFRQTAPEMSLQVDGGIDENSLAMVIQAGAQHVVIGSQIFHSPIESFKHLEDKAKETREFGHEVKHEIKKIAFAGGSGWDEDDQPYKDAYELSKVLAKKGFEIINGGGPGIMRASTKGAHAGGGEVLAVTYYPAYKHKNYEGVDPLNNFDEEIITTDYFDRTKVMLQNTDLHIIFNGSTGTISELGMTWASSRIHEGHNKPIILFGDFWKHIVEEIKDHMLMRPGEVELLKIVTTTKEALDYIESLKK